MAIGVVFASTNSLVRVGTYQRHHSTCVSSCSGRYARLGSRQGFVAMAGGRDRLNDSLQSSAVVKSNGRNITGSLVEAAGRVGCLLACLLVVQQGVLVPVVYADDSNLSAYEKRKLENERRKEMLRSLREKAEQGASQVVDAPPPVYTPSAAPQVPKAVTPAPAPAPAPAPLKGNDSPSSFSPSVGGKSSSNDASPSFSIPKMDMPKMDMPKMDMPKLDMPKMDMPKLDMPKMPSFSFGGGDDTPPTTTKPDPVVVAPKPPKQPEAIVVPAPKPEPVKKYTPPQVAMPQSTPKVSSQGDTLDQWRQQQKKDLEARKKLEKKAEVTRNKAKKGAMPVWLAEFLLIGSFIGFGFASVIFGSQIAAIYKKVDTALTDLFFTKS